MEKLEFYQKNKTKIWLIIFLLIIGIIIAGLLFFPEIFYDQWIWKYYWGPVVADSDLFSSTAVHNGVVAEEGYTIVSELTYGFLLVASIFIIYKGLKKLRITIDWEFAIALMPYILYGPITRVLEDAGYFSQPINYWFISPLIYVQTAIFAIVFLMIGRYIENKYKKDNLTAKNILLIGGLFLLIPSFAIYFLYAFESEILRLNVFVLIIGLATLITGLVYMIGWLLSNIEKFKELKAFMNPLNLLMVFGHLIDGITSYISIKDPLGMGLSYVEKHPASNILLEIWGPLFPIVKFLLIIIVIFVFDVLFKKELKDHITLVNLIKISILILGFSPGLRDLLRVAIGT